MSQVPATPRNTGSDQGRTISNYSSANNEKESPHSLLIGLIVSAGWLVLLLILLLVLYIVFRKYRNGTRVVGDPTGTPDTIRYLRSGAEGQASSGYDYVDVDNVRPQSNTASTAMIPRMGETTSYSDSAQSGSGGYIDVSGIQNHVVNENRPEDDNDGYMTPSSNIQRDEI